MSVLYDLKQLIAHTKRIIKHAAASLDADEFRNYIYEHLIIESENIRNSYQTIEGLRGQNVSDDIRRMQKKYESLEKVLHHLLDALRERRDQSPRSRSRSRSRGGRRRSTKKVRRS
jgi:hypothetical protein